ncbi:MAG: DNA repair protein RecO [Candidatus Omnitrophota bacterium]
MAIIKTEAIVLKRYDLRETSLLAVFFTLDFGKISGELKGVRADPGKFASPVEVFSHNEIVFYQKRNSSVHLVSQCDLKNAFIPIKQNMRSIAAASVMVELLDGIMPQEDKNEEVFQLAVSALSELSAVNSDKITTVFKIKLLSLSGFKPHFDSCVSCGLSVMARPKFSLKLGGLLCYKCNFKDNSARAIFKGTIATILYIEKNNLRNNLALGMNPQIKKELDLVLNSFLNFHLGKELKSQMAINKLTAAGAFG